MTILKGSLTHQEILSQPEAWAAALSQLQDKQADLQRFDPARLDQILFTGCGSTYYLSLAAAALTQELTGYSCRALPASELWLYPHSSYGPGKTLLVAVSRSGETSETLRACQAFQESRRGILITLTCSGSTPLAGLGQFNLVFPSGQEQSVAQTRAFSTLYLGTVAMAALWADRSDLFASLAELPEAGRRLLNTYASLAAELGQDTSVDRFYWLGSGSRYGLACELSLKVKEMSLSQSEPFHFMEFRHGPKSMVAPSALVVGLHSATQHEPEASVLADVRSLGGRVLSMGWDGDQVAFGDHLEEAACNVLHLPVGQLIAWERATSRGLDPDRPTNLEAVVKLG